METPIHDFLRGYAERDALRLHMPGHKGVTLTGAEPFDITEISGADVLYSSGGIIRKSEKNAAKLFGTARTVYSAEGSSLSIRAMLYMVCLFAAENGKRPIIAAGRNAHKTFMNAAAMLDFDIMWLCPSVRMSDVCCSITPKELDTTLTEAIDKPCAVYITSPDYLGNTADIPGLSAVCRNHGALLIVDNAHGAYLNFLPQSRHPIAQGADMCADSAHKTLPALTGGGYLHISKNAPTVFSDMCESAMALFASTSPSYLILESLDLVNRYISEGYREKLAEAVNRVDGLKRRLSDIGFTLAGDEPMKITLMPKSFGYTGNDIGKILFDTNIVCEFSAEDSCTLMFTPEVAETGCATVLETLSALPRKGAIETCPPPLHLPRRIMSVRRAVFSPSEEIPTHLAVGRIMAESNAACPPAVPIAVCGEELSQDTVDALIYYGYSTVRVVKN